MLTSLKWRSLLEEGPTPTLQAFVQRTEASATVQPSDSASTNSVATEGPSDRRGLLGGVPSIGGACPVSPHDSGKSRGTGNGSTVTGRCDAHQNGGDRL